MTIDRLAALLHEVECSALTGDCEVDHQTHAARLAAAGVTVVSTDDRCTECGVPFVAHPDTDACAIAGEARDAERAVTVGIDPARLARDMRTIAAMATDPSHDKVALIVTLGRIHDIARAYEEASDADR